MTLFFFSWFSPAVWIVFSGFVCHVDCFSRFFFFLFFFTLWFFGLWHWILWFVCFWMKTQQVFINLANKTLKAPNPRLMLCFFFSLFYFYGFALGAYPGSKPVRSRSKPTWQSFPHREKLLSLSTYLFLLYLKLFINFLKLKS